MNITANGALQFKWSRVDLIYNPLYLGTGAGSNNPSQVQACLQDTSKTPEEPPHCLIGGRINHVSVAHEGSLIIYGGSYKELHQMRHGGGESTFYSR